MAPTITLVDNIPALDACLADISSVGMTKLAVDLEGVDLCRLGKISLLQILADNSNIIWLVDITVLGKLAFDHTDTDGRSLRNVLENDNIRKVSSITLSGYQPLPPFHNLILTVPKKFQLLDFFRCSKRRRLPLQSLQH